MTSRLISFVGTGEYRETLYVWGEKEECATPYLAEALCRFFAIDEVVLLGTEAAFATHGDGITRRLRDAGARFDWRDIPDGRTEDEQWTQFSALVEALADEDELVVDITHGFRSQPFMAGSALALLRSAGRLPDSVRIVYGEYRREENRSLVWDLSAYLDLTAWAEALALFLKTGVANDLVELGKRERHRLAKHEQSIGGRDFPRFGPLVEAIRCFADDLATVRLAAMLTGYVQDGGRKSRPPGSARRLLEALESCREEVESALPALGLILDRITGIVTPLVADRLGSEDGHQAQVALARLYLELDRLPEAAIVLREGVVNRLAGDPRAVEVGEPGFDHDRRMRIEATLYDHPLIRNIAYVRNDIEHGGMCRQPLAGGQFRKRIDVLIDEFAALPSAEGRGTVRGRTWFVSRHPGARAWAERQGIDIDEVVDHFDLEEIGEDDVVIGTLPVHLAAAVCRQGAIYRHLSLDLPPGERGRELSADDMERLGARLETFHIV